MIVAEDFVEDYFEDGVIAALDGHGHYTNPHPIYTEAHSDWKAGWESSAADGPEEDGPEEEDA